MSHWICLTARYPENKCPLLQRPIAQKIYTLPPVVSSVTAGSVHGAESVVVLPFIDYLPGRTTNNISSDFTVTDNLPLRE